MTGKSGGTDLEFLAMENYLTRTQGMSMQTAREVDQEIKAQFPTAPTGVVTKWTAYLLQVRLAAAAVAARTTRSRIQITRAIHVSRRARSSSSSFGPVRFIAELQPRAPVLIQSHPLFAIFSATSTSLRSSDRGKHIV